MAFPQRSASWREGSGLWPYFLLTCGPTGFRSFRWSSSLSCNRHLRLVHRCRLASPGAETSSSLQHSVAETAETVMVSTGFDRPFRAPSTAEDQAYNRATIFPCRGKTRAGVTRERRRDRQDCARPLNIVLENGTALPAVEGLRHDLGEAPRKTKHSPNDSLTQAQPCRT